MSTFQANNTADGDGGEYGRHSYDRQLDLNGRQ
jgi:hypothetical protein